MKPPPPPFTARFENDAEGLWLVYPTVPGWHYRIESSPTPATEEAVSEFEFVPGSFRYGDGQEQRWWLAPAPPPATPPATPPPERTYFSATLHFHISSDPNVSPPQVEVVRKDFDGEVLWKRHLPFSLPGPNFEQLNNPNYHRPFFVAGNSAQKSWFLFGIATFRLLDDFESDSGDSFLEDGGEYDKEYDFVMEHWEEILGDLTPHPADASLDPEPPPPGTPPPPPPDPGVRRFFRVRQTAVDSNHNGLPDWWELANNYSAFATGTADPNYAAGGGDTDRDGLTNMDEYVAGTDPRNPDSDGDLAPDGQEKDHETDPLNASSTPFLIVSVHRWMNDNKEANGNVFDWGAWGYTLTEPDPLTGVEEELFYFDPVHPDASGPLNSGYPDFNTWHVSLGTYDFPPTPPWWAKVFARANGDFGSSSILPGSAEYPLIDTAPHTASGQIYLPNNEGGDYLEQRRLWLRGPVAGPGGYSRTYVLRKERVKGHFEETGECVVYPTDEFTVMTVTFTTPEGQRVSNFVDLLPTFESEPSSQPPSTYFHIVRWSLLPAIVTNLEDTQISSVPRWMPNDGVGKGLLVSGGNPYAGLTLSFGTNSATLVAFGETFNLTETSPDVWATANSSATVHLLTFRSPSAAVRESLLVRIDAAGPGLAASEYEFFETTENSNTFSAAVPSIRFELPAELSESEPDSAAFDITEGGLGQTWTLEETGSDTRVFAGSGRVVTILSSTSGVLRLRVAGTATPEEGSVFGLQFRDGAWQSYEAAIHSDLPPASPSDEAKWHVVIRGLGNFSAPAVPVEFVEEYRDSPDSEWTSEVLGTGVLTSTGGDLKTAKPVVILTPGSDIDDVPVAARGSHYILQAGKRIPSSPEKRVTVRYTIRAVGSENWPAGQSFVSVVGTVDAAVMRSLDFATETGQGLDEEDEIEEPLEDLGYTTYRDLGIKTADIKKFLNSKEILYLGAHGMIKDQVSVRLPSSPAAFDPGAEFAGMKLKDGLQMTAAWMTAEALYPELVMMAGCLSGMTDADLALARTNDLFMTGSEQFADAFNGSAYLGVAWDVRAGVAFTFMKNYVSHMDKTRSYRLTFEEYRHNHTAADDKLLKLYQYDDATHVGNNRKPMEKAASANNP